MASVNAADKKFTACGDPQAEALLKSVLSEIGSLLAGSGLCVCLGGSYGRGDGGVRLDKENGILYNDLDFFVFARNRNSGAAKLLEEIAEKYEKTLQVDVDFSSVMSIDNIRRNAPRLMLQELKRGYHLVCGEDLLMQYLPELPAEELPFDEACRLLLNRGMGLLLAGEKIFNSADDMDFILRNINKAILGVCDAYLIARHSYCWKISDRLAAINDSALPDCCKKFYAQAVEFKKSPSRTLPQDLPALWCAVRDMFLSCVKDICGESCEDIYLKCRDQGILSLKNYIKYCVKNRTLPLADWQYYTMPPTALLANSVYRALSDMPQSCRVVTESKLYRQWLIFN